MYLDELRKVPVCVVLAPTVDRPEPSIRPVVFPSSTIGGGFPVIVVVQGREHIASIGCLVRDGHTVYALTNRHVTGPEGEPVFAQLGGERVRIGVSSSKQLTRLANPATIYAFDLTPDGKRIVFDRIRENSDIRMIDLKKK